MRCCKCSLYGVIGLLLILNVIFFAIGVSLLSVGTYLHINENYFSYVTGNNVSGSLLLIISGTVVTLMGLIGVISVVISWLPMIIVVVLFLVILLQMSSCIAGFISYVDLKDNVKSYMLQALQNYPVDRQSTDEAVFVDHFQNQYSCCGYTGPDDWLNTTFLNDQLTLPSSCMCNSTLITCGQLNYQHLQINVWNEGCESFIENTIKTYGLGIGISAIVLTVLQILTFILVTCLCCCKCYQRKKSSFSPKKL